MVAVAILAAGRGTRMKSSLPKVLHPLGGRTLLERVLDSLQNLSVDHCLVVVGYGAEQVQQAMAAYPHLTFVEQRQQLGTGHAAQQVLPYLENYEGDLLVLNGDVPLLRPETLNQLITTHQQQGNAATLLTAQLPNPKGYGRVFCDGSNRVTQIVEDRDCSTAQKQNQRINAGVYCFRWPVLAEVLPKLQTNNDQQEYYLTDTVLLMQPVMAVDVEDYQEILGINDRLQLANAHGVLQQRVKEQWMRLGVTLIDPDSITIDDQVQIHPDAVIEPQTHLRGISTIGAGCRIGPGTLIENSTIHDQTTVLYSVVTDSTVGAGSRVGPYSHLRGEVTVGDRCRIGNFVELKATTVGDRTNVAHLTYLGNATVGAHVNVGAGTITANYDGYQKHPTVIGDRTKTGSNSVLVAPLTIGTDVTIAAGSVITQDVPSDSLAIARAQQTVKPGWRPKQLPPQA
ncbi:MAG: bifunctional UDP-N-acetylglucosamine diphosphorylase/glucosamine-1-phosphate N-acetyltransferase GlmU [Kaiparowitsia implicata GSE-PSE-MK54-09C]|jgi:bifunctional UDP-N-acetylglucosamine pyrophosphorylase/glucosamine-1-phosphate N-acetyltransferase|nr:bifunctional UDP-N-acetylglucosamine diphosphorylase/glucosamine-1-phosphate N-acetyltransferase GlmU [Kaiparowitsia implicata GSE-PSE-MK54-09C]